jgi:HKD family nuclease
MGNYKGWRRLAEKNTINLLNAINKQKNYDLIIFTTFTFDPIFFDGYILRKIKQNNPNATIIILMDSKNYSILQKDFTRETGVEYALIPISGKVFHSKIFIFASKSKKNVFLGSHNLTLSGLTQNLELSVESNNCSLVDECILYVHSLLQKNLDSKNPWYLKIESYLSEKIEHSNLITNENEPILKQCLNLVSKKYQSIDEVIIFSPYFSKINDILKQINQLQSKQIKLCIQKNNHNLDIHDIETFDNLSLNEIKPKESRRIHAKFIAFKMSGKNLLLVGSPNLTSPALLKNSEDGNFESALLLEQNFETFVSALKIKSISKEEIENSKRTFIESEESERIPEIIIKFAYLDDFNKLNIEYISKLAKTVIAEFNSNENKSITKPLELDKGQNIITVLSLPQDIHEFYFSENDQIISNIIRICNPKGMKKRTGFELEDSKSVQKSLNEVTDFEDIANFCLTLFSSEIEKIGDTPKTRTSKSSPSLGKKTTSKTSSGITDLLNKLFRLSVNKTTKNTSAKIDSTNNPSKVKEIDEILSDLIKRLITKFERDIIPKTNFTKRYSAFLVISLKLLKNFSQGQFRGISSVHVISGLNQMIVNDPDFDNLDNIEKFEILYLIIELAKEVSQNLSNPHKFDEEAILMKLKPIIVDYIQKTNPIMSIIQDLDNSEKYNFTKNISNEYHDILKELFQQIFIRFKIIEKFEFSKKLIYELDHENDYKKMSSGYDKLKLFLEKDYELRDKLKFEMKNLENQQNIIALDRIISEFEA